MMDPASTAWRVVVAILAPIVIYLIAVGLSTLTWVQRHILYLHKAPIALWTKLHIPESLGFLKNQVAPFRIETSDGEKLYAWLIAPLKLYSTYEKDFLNDEGPARLDVEASAAFARLRSDPESRLVIYFHGNSAHIGQSRRTDEYRNLSSGAPDKIFILTFDYRGFGLSSGTPSEEGLIIDAVSVVRWAMEIAGIPPRRILLFSQSLGCAVATAAAEYFITAEPKIEFGGLMLCTAFTSGADAFLDFVIPGKIPLMGLVKFFPGGIRLYKRLYKDKWTTSDRITKIVQRSSRLRLTLVHAVGDKIIPWRHCDSLFYCAASATSSQGLSPVEVDEKKEKYDLQQGGWLCKWVAGDKIIKQRILLYGGHDSIMKWEPVALLVLRSFELE